MSTSGNPRRRLWHDSGNVSFTRARAIGSPSRVWVGVKIHEPAPESKQSAMRGALSRAIRAGLVSVSLAATISCRPSYPTTPGDLGPVALEVHYTSATSFLTPGGRLFRAYVLKADGAYEDVTSKTSWSSSDTSVLRPSAVAGNMVAVAPGIVELRAQYAGLTNSIWLTVIASQSPPYAYPYLDISSGDPRVVANTSRAVARLNLASRVSQDVTAFVTWESSNNRVVTVERGLVSAIGPGTAQITASYDGLTAWYGLSVEPPSR